MTEFIATLGEDQATIKHVEKMVQEGEYSHCWIIQSATNTQHLKTDKKITTITFNPDFITAQLAAHLQQELQGKINDFEVAVNIISGNGREHMALLSALLKVGLGLRLVVYTKEGIVEL
ncbi:hypothetical protein HZB02_02985 [Candidatus Woesearchaeota archaeon]|nr:hypothetical protein [Candidatus Woesearchaeota archaeon]